MEKCCGPNCDRDAFAKSLCLAHYKQRRNGRSLRPLIRHLTDTRAKLLAGHLVDERTGCWEWQLPLSEGYGRVPYEGRTIGAHVASVIVLRGEQIPPGHEVCHACGNRACINPDHLYVGTRSSNIADALDHGTFPVGEHHYAAKLTEADVLAIRADHRSSEAELGRRYGIAASTAGQIRRGARWRHVHQPSALRS